jgi:hypothetical protein
MLKIVLVFVFNFKNVFLSALPLGNTRMRAMFCPVCCVEILLSARTVSGFSAWRQVSQSLELLADQALST